MPYLAIGTVAVGAYFIGRSSGGWLSHAIVAGGAAYLTVKVIKARG